MAIRELVAILFCILKSVRLRAAGIRGSLFQNWWLAAKGVHFLLIRVPPV